MAPATFDGVNLLITLPAPTGGLLTVDVQQDIYSDWKVWVKDSGGHQFEPAFDTTGGDPIPGSQAISGSYFLRNDLGWRIQTTDADQEVTILGNLYPRDETIDTFIARPTRTIALNTNLTANPRDLSSADVTLIRKRLYNREYTNPVSNDLELYDDADVAIEASAPIFKDDGVTPWDGTGPIRRRDKLT
jgi:hypothetical protein